MVSIAVTEGYPTVRAAIGGIGILCYFVAISFAPKSDNKKETNLQKFVFGLEIIMLILAFLMLMAMIGMIDESLVNAGYLSPDVLHYVPESP
jgi:NhaP-type Na+/H+ and K+/H+ antiporter